MSVDRVSTLGVFQSTLTNITKTFNDLSTLQTQISSGFKSQNFAGIFDDARQYMQLTDQIDRTTHYLSNNSIIESRIQTSSNVLSQVISTGTSLKSLIAQRRTASLNVGVFGSQLEAAWKTLTSQLNIKLDGRSLFGGGKTDVKPVDEEVFPTLNSDGVPGEEYYHGDNQDLSVRIADGVDIIYNVRANDEGFKDIFAALAAAKEGDETNNDDKLAQAFDLLEDGLQKVIILQAKANSNVVQINDTKTNLTSLQTYWKSLSEGIANTDLVSASTQVAINQGILQASFQIFARISSLRLADFLK
jgi:flagellar hook-associated protein 3 FlgL